MFVLGGWILFDDGCMSGMQSWTVSDALWSKVEPLIPVSGRSAGRSYQRRAGAGRKRKDARLVFSAIVYVLRTGCQWKALPREFGSASSVHKYFQVWHQVDFFQKLWQAGVAEYDGMHGIAWQWQAADGAMGKAPLATECAGRNPTDRGKKRTQAQSVSRRSWTPAIDRRQRRQRPRLEASGSNSGPDRGQAS